MISFDDPAFLQDPYPVLNAVREKTPIFRQAKTQNGQEIWFLTRHDEVQLALRDRRLGRVFDHVLTYEQAGVDPPDADLGPYHEIGRAHV